MQISSDKTSAIANIWGRQSTTKSEEFVQKRDSTSEAYTLDLSEAAQHIIVDRGDHDELMYYIERHGFVPEVQKKYGQEAIRKKFLCTF